MPRTLLFFIMLDKITGLFLQCIRRHPLENHFYRLDRTVIVEFHFIDCHHTVITVFIRDGPSVIHHDIFIRARFLDDGMVACAGGDITLFGL